MKALGLVFVLLVAISKAARKGPNNFERCETINIPMCKNLPYNETRYPNSLGNTNQDDAAKDIHTYHPMVKINCSPDIQLFLCSMYAPPCTILEKPLLPCRDLCESAREGCISLLKSFQYTWPTSFECSKFPKESTSENLCISRKASSIQKEIDHIKTPTLVPSIPNNYDEMMDFVCPNPLKAPKDLDYQFRVGDVLAQDCGAPCNGMFFSKDTMNVLRTFSGIFAVIAFIFGMFTIFTYFIDTSRFPYPQMAIVHMTVCYTVVSLCYIFGFAFNDGIACGEAFEFDQANLATERLIRQGTIKDWRCSVSGMSLYFFTIAGSLWWVMLTFAWFSQAGLKWAEEGLQGKSSYLHAIVWTISAILTVMNLVLKNIEGDIYSGICFVGLWNSNTLLWFVIIPRTLCVLVGVIFLVLGYWSMYRTKMFFKSSGQMTDKLGCLMKRIVCFSICYLFPCAALIFCEFYEYIHLDKWLSYWQEKVCRDPELSTTWQVPCRYPNHFLNQAKLAEPELWLYYVKYTAIFLIAMFSGTWVWCGKTLATWKHMYHKISGKDSAIYDRPIHNQANL